MKQAISFWVTDDQRKQINDRARALRITRSDYVRHLVLPDVAKGPVPFRIEPAKENPLVGKQQAKLQNPSKAEPQKNGSSPDLLTCDEAVAYCRLRSSYKLRLAVRRRELQAFRLGFRTIRFRRSEFDRWLDSKRTRIIK